MVLPKTQNRAFSRRANTVCRSSSLPYGDPLKTAHFFGTHQTDGKKTVERVCVLYHLLSSKSGFSVRNNVPLCKHLISLVMD
jgi:hypothetical protein